MQLDPIIIDNIINYISMGTKRGLELACCYLDILFIKAKRNNDTATRDEIRGFANNIDQVKERLKRAMLAD